MSWIIYSMLNILLKLQQHNIISSGDYYFAELIAEKQRPFNYPEPIQQLAVLLAALANYSYQQGNTCLYLDHNLEHNLFSLCYRKLDDDCDYLTEIKQKIANLPISQWQQKLQCHIAFSEQPQNKVAPLVFQFNALYFYRVWQDEFRLAEYLKSTVCFSRVLAKDFPADNLRNILTHYFLEPKETTDWQKIAVAMSLRQPFSLISGGPGTGKTYTVARLLAAAQELHIQLHNKPLRIALAAPTGKAATRLTESIGNALSEMELSQKLRQFIPTKSQTIHRLLGVGYFTEEIKFNKLNPLPIDLLVVDEASMIDLSLMAKLLQALRAQTKLVLLGDKDQLASVEAGAILGELGQFIEQDYSLDFTTYLNHVTGQQLIAKEQGNPIRDHLCYLRESRRFSQDSGIGHLAKAVNEGNAERSWQLFEHYSDLSCIVFEPQDDADKNYYARCLELVLQSAVEIYADFLQTIHRITQQNLPFNDENLKDIFDRFNSVRFLTALRVGEFGLENLNQIIAERLRQKGLLQFKHSRDWYLGKPIIVNQNDANAGLFNGDIGLYLGNSRVFFETGNGYKSLSVSRVPSHETAFAMTVHKSQGSEFSHTVLVLPPELSPVLSKELVYTAVTRAKHRLTVFSKESIWKSAVKNPIKRQSGLGKLLSINNSA